MLPPSLLSTPVSRLIAQLIDSLFDAACIAPGILVFAIGLSNNWDLTSVLGAVGILIGVVGVLWVQIRLLPDGQTVGKRQMGLRIVHFPTLDLVTLGVSFGMRFLVAQGLIGAIPGVGPIYGLADALFVFSEDRRCLHDRIAGTLVVNDATWLARYDAAAAYEATAATDAL